MKGTPDYIEGYEDGHAAGMSATLELAGIVATLPAILTPTKRQDCQARPPSAMDALADAIAQADPLALAILRPFDRAETINLKTAAEIAGRSESTIRGWCLKYAIGRLMGGTLAVSRVALAMFLDDDPIALHAYLRGNRDGIVRGYFDRVGLIESRSLASLAAS